MLNENVLDLDFSTMSKREIVAAAEELRRIVYKLGQRNSDASPRPSLIANENTSAVRFASPSAQGTKKADAFLDKPQRWVWRTDPDHRLQEIVETSSPNGSSVDTTDLGRTRWAILGIDPDEDPNWRQHVTAMERREVFRDFRFSFVSRTERTYHVSIDGDPIFDRDGTFQGYSGTGRDITEEVHKEQSLKKLREENDRFQQILENLPVMMNAFDEDGVCVSWNRECERITGYSAAEMIGNPDVPVLAMPDPAYRARMTKRWPSKGNTRDWEVEFTSKDGRALTIAWSSILEIRSIPGWASWAIGVDVTERNAAQQNLAQQKERLQATLETLHEGVIIADGFGNIVDANPAVTRMFGWSRDELIGENLRMLMHREEARSHDAYLKNYRTSGVPHIIGKGRQLTAKRKDGQTFPIHLSVEGFEQSGELFFVGSVQNISEKMALEEGQRQSEKLAALGQLAGGIAHDFNNLLLPIITLTQLAMDEQPYESKAAERLSVVLEAAERGRGLVDKFLTFSREEQLLFEDLELEALIDEGIELVRSSAPANVTIHSAIGPTRPIMGNSGEFIELIVNLVRNGVDAVGTKRGEVVVRVDEIHSTSETEVHLAKVGSCVRLAFHDTGGGMSESVRRRAFEPFFTTKKVGQGSGLGLSVVHGIVTRMGGIVEISSSGMGTVVSVFLPLPETKVN